MAAGFKTATVNASSVPSTQTNFPSYVDLSRIGITTLAEAQSVRVYADSTKTTEWAREIVSATEMHVKVPSLTSTVTMYVDWDGVRADYAVTDTYGRNAVWSDYLLVMHLNAYEASPVNATGGTTGTSFNLGSGDEVAGAIKGGMGMLTATDYISMPVGAVSTYALQAIVKRNGNSGIVEDAIIERTTSVGSFTTMQFLRLTATGLVTFQARNGTGAENFAVNSSVAVTNNAWRWVTGVQVTGDQRLYIDGALNASGTTTHGANALATNFFINRTYDASARHLLAQYDEIRIRNESLTTNWVTTEYNNQSNEATFWGTWTSAGGSNTTNFFAMM